VSISATPQSRPGTVPYKGGRRNQNDQRLHPTIQRHNPEQHQDDGPSNRFFQIRIHQ
jgi:hypothetical protein